jgi:hypothetical protein
MHGRLPTLLLGLALVLLAAGCGKERPAPEKEPVASDRPKPAVEEKPPVKEKPPEKVKEVEQPAFTVTAAGLAGQFAADAAKAEKKFAGKLVAVEGLVSTARQNIVKGTGEVTLVGKKGEQLPFEVACTVKKARAGTVGLLSRWQQVRVTGRFVEGGAAKARLDECDYEELTPGTTPTVTAEAVTKEFKADSAAAEKKYKDRDLIVTGTVDELAARNGFWVRLAGTGGLRVSCDVEEDEFQSLKKGDRVRIKGEASIFDTGGLTLVSAFLLPPKG